MRLGLITDDFRILLTVVKRLRLANRIRECHARRARALDEGIAITLYDFLRI